MSDFFEIFGKKPLRGEIEVRGSKNAAGPLLAATLLTDKECIIDNVPKIIDILDFIDILKSLGKEIEWIGERSVRIREKGGISLQNLNFEKISKSRISVLLMGSLLARMKEFKISRPGGDRIGLRPIDTHIMALRQLGAEVEKNEDFYFVKRKQRLHGNEIVLPEFSVTATENLLLASVLAEGVTVIKGAAKEPHVQNLIEMLQKMGARITKTWCNVIKVQGVEKLEGVRERVIPDTNEAGTFLIIGSLLAEKMRVKNVVPGHLDLFLQKLQETGVRFEKGKDFIEIEKCPSLRPVKVQALPYPGFPTDLLPLIVPLLTQAEGRSLIHDPLYENRLNYIHELRKMGADIEIVDPHRAFVFGKTNLFGERISSWDIRAGASLVVAGLIAEGRTIVENIYQIDRGHEKIEERLQKLGAEIRRIKK